MSELGNELRRLRQSQGLRLDDVAEKTGFTKAYLSDIERGRRGTIDATIATLNRIFAVYGVRAVVRIEEAGNEITPELTPDVKPKRGVVSDKPRSGAG